MAIAAKIPLKYCSPKSFFISLLDLACFKIHAATQTIILMALLQPRQLFKQIIKKKITWR
jgi:hypothetical protein